ncbi:MAG: hypothetical protein WC737_05700 [Parcubacteria group bacterium]|jgi:hypothetical protein
MAEKNPLDIVAEAEGIRANLFAQKAEYEVISPAGLFKNGVQYEQGKTIILDKFTGGNQERAKAVKLIKDL